MGNFLYSHKLLHVLSTTFGSLVSPQSMSNRCLPIVFGKVKSWDVWRRKVVEVWFKMSLMCFDAMGHEQAGIVQSARSFPCCQNSHFQFQNSVALDWCFELFAKPRNEWVHEYRNRKRKVVIHYFWFYNDDFIWFLRRISWLVGWVVLTIHGEVYVVTQTLLKARLID